jgi:hypothetical protein
VDSELRGFNIVDGLGRTAGLLPMQKTRHLAAGGGEFFPRYAGEEV